tara:strand:+ start:20109 stop:20492 length:384 start_codon:yes stop_codon:yes gene_type:complete
MLYNTSLNIDYKHEKYKNENNSEYQKQFLKAFHIEKYDEKIVIEKMDQIYDDICNDNNMKKLFNEVKNRNKIFPFELKDKDLFSLLFSYDTFDLVHLFIKDYYENDYVNDKTYENFINKAKTTDNFF